MSLINEALKKAQKQRSKETAPPLPGVPASPVDASSKSLSAPSPYAAKKPRSTRPLVIVGLCAVGLSAVSVGTTLFILQPDAPARTSEKKASAASSVSKPSPPAVSAPASVAPAAAPAAAPASLAPAVVLAPAAPTPAPLPVSSTPVAATTPPAPLATSSTLLPKSETSSLPPTAPAGPSKESMSPVPRVAEVSAQSGESEAALRARVTEPGKPSLRTQGVVDKLRVAGIRVSPTESKVILNERLYRLNDLVDPVLGLRLTVVELHALTFTDATGATYVKLF